MAFKPLSPFAIVVVGAGMISVVVGVVAARNAVGRSAQPQRPAVSVQKSAVLSVTPPVGNPSSGAQAAQPDKEAASAETHWPGVGTETAAGATESPTTGDPEAISLYEGSDDLTPRNRVDELVFAKLKELKIQPARLCSDCVFLRRIYLDMTGTLPSEEDARKFLEDKSPGKRRELIERLFQTEDYTDYWAMKWSDVLRIKAEFPINLWPNAAQAYHRWVRTAIRDNMPYDRFVRDMLTTSGSNFRIPQVNFYRAQQGRDPKVTAQMVALTFMGTRADKWPGERLAGMANFFAQIQYKGTAEWKEEIILFEPGKILEQEGGAEKLKAVFPDGTPIQLAPDRDPREVFADWLITEKNPWFSTIIVNRLWGWLLGRGIIQEVDDIRDDNPPQNAELLEYLKQELVQSGYDMRHVNRLILNSKAYQLSPVPRADAELSAANFGHYPIRRVEGEVLIDAICQITGTTESYDSAIPEPFSWIPEGYRTIALPDGSITSSFLEDRKSTRLNSSHRT